MDQQARMFHAALAARPAYDRVTLHPKGKELRTVTGPVHRVTVVARLKTWGHLTCLTTEGKIVEIYKEDVVRA